MKYSLFALTLLLGAATLAPAEDDETEKKDPAPKKDFRVFKSSKGKELELRVVSRIDDEQYKFEAPDGKTFTIKVANLSDADQDFLMNWEPGGAKDLVGVDLSEIFARMDYATTDLTAAGRYKVATVTVGGQEVKMILDPGRDWSLIEPDVATNLGITLSAAGLNLNTADGKQVALQQGIAESVAIGEVTVTKQKFIVLEISNLGATVPATVKGIMGGDLLRNFNAVVDYGGARLFATGAGE